MFFYKILIYGYKKESEIEIKDNERKDVPSIEVNQNGNIFSNFINNFKKQFNNVEGLGLGRLFGKNMKDTDKKNTEALDIMGKTKSVVNFEIKITQDNSPQQEIKSHQQLDRLLNNKPKIIPPNNKKSKLKF